jgi:arylsulfatase A-like enzyme
VDVLPTVLDLVGLPPMPGLDGESLAPALEGGEVSGDRTLYAMGRAFRWEEGARSALPEPPDRPLSIAVIRPDRYYIRGPGGEELYLADDPGQEHNVVETDPLAGELRALAYAAAGPAPGSEREPLDPELEERLRSLGYLH